MHYCMHRHQEDSRAERVNPDGKGQGDEQANAAADARDKSRD